MNKKVIIACDFSCKKKIFEFLDIFKNEQIFIKIGMELFYSQGPEIVENIKALGYNIFLDLKLHDIPNTVSRTVNELIKLKVDLISLHSLGGANMMKAAVDIAAGSPTKLIAITLLTSISEEVLKNELLINKDLTQLVGFYARNSFKYGIHGVVCSAYEVPTIKSLCGNDFLCITPGIKPEGWQYNDQKRVASPAIAGELGSDFIVVGRAITCASDPLVAYTQIKNDFLKQEVTSL
ncbi:MAG: orotidine-5'-phosphate decarboxylase [Candidatus Improbicoccus devescovinae]|nr:MAG: orotidine-5'-phosphate decarboxylase [Candidatus Improbicoccus devescovinae]